MSTPESVPSAVSAVPSVPRTYAGVIVPNPAYSATVYRSRLPFAILIPALTGVLVILSFFLPWLTIGNSLLSCSFTGFQTANGATCLIFTRSFPPLLLLLPISIAQIIFAAFLFWDKIVTTSKSWFILISFGLGLLLEIIYFFWSFFGASQTGNASILLATSPSSGLFVSILVTLVAGGTSLFLFPDLRWCWALAQDDLDRIERIGKHGPIYK